VAKKEALTRAQRLPFLEALHDLVTSGMSAGEAVRLLSVRIKEPALRTLSVSLWERLSEGAPLSRAMADFPAVFDSATINLIQAGEATGSLNDTLARLITHLHEQRELRRQLLAALAYPVFMVVVAMLVILFFLFFLLPRLQTLLTSLGGELPLSTKMLVAMANFALHYGVFIAVGVIAGAIAFWRWRETDAGREATDNWMLRLPLVGPFVVSQTVLAFSQTLSVLLANGITAAEALRMTGKQIANRVHRRAFDEATGRVLEGESLSLSLSRTGCFPDLVLDRLAVGENTGNVVPSLREISRSYQKRVSGQLNIFTKVIASAVLLMVFVLVGFIAFAIVSAVFKVSSSFKLSS
jgi:type II secretory pathway component PulF